MPDMLVLISPSAVEKIKLHSQKLCRVLQEATVAALNPQGTEEGEITSPKQVTVYGIPCIFVSGDASDIQILGIASASEKRLLKLTGLAETLRKAVRKFFTESKISLSVEVWPIMPPGKWLLAIG